MCVTSLGDTDLLVKSASEERLMSISVRVHLPKKENGVYLGNLRNQIR